MDMDNIGRAPLPLGIMYSAPSGVTFSSRSAFLSSRELRQKHTPSSNVTAGIAGHQLPTLLPNLIDTRPVEITGDKEEMGQRGFVCFASSPVTGRTGLVCLPNLTFMPACFLKRQFVLKLRVKACLFRAL